MREDLTLLIPSLGADNGPWQAVDSEDLSVYFLIMIMKSRVLPLLVGGGSPQPPLSTSNHWFDHLSTGLTTSQLV